MSHHDIEPTLGLPEELPAGEYILWQGQPNWRLLSGRALHLRGLALYLGVLVVARGLFTWSNGSSVGTAVIETLPALGLALTAWVLLAVIGWMSARATMYTITNRRVVMRIGIAVPLTLNLPLRRLESAALKRDGRGHGDISLVLTGQERFAYFLLWPHARPWRFAPAEPTLRAVSDVERVGEILCEAMTQETLVRITLGDALEAGEGQKKSNERRTFQPQRVRSAS